MSDLRDLYQEVILDHHNHPRNYGELENFAHTHHAHGDNPLCGDQYDIALEIEEGEIADVRFDGEGCAISKAAASMMTKYLKGTSVEDAKDLVEAFRRLLTKEETEGDLETLGHLKVFKGVSSRPERIKCAVLPWHTVKAAIEGKKEVSTEGSDLDY